MELKRAANVIQSEDVVNQATQVVKDLAMKVYGGGGKTKRSIRNALFGTWLGHPLHPLIVVVPAGAWAMTEVLDVLEAVTGDKGYGRAADVTVVTGMAGALLAVTSGLNDWRFTSGKTSRLGLVHGASNLAGVAAMGLSMAMRMTGSRGAARVLSTLGLGVTAVAAYIGGELVYAEHVGVSHVRSEGLPHEFESVMSESELPEGELHGTSVKGKPIVLLRRGDRIFALADMCSHMGGPLHKGSLDGDCVICPWHASTFSMANGRVVDGPATFPQPVFDVRIRDHQIEVRLAPDSE